MNKLRKVGICGVGHVGAHCAYSLMLQGICDEIVLVDILEAKVISEHQDLSDAVGYMPHRVKVTYETYADFKDCDIVVMSVGVIHEGERDRLLELQSSKEMIDQCLDGIFGNGFHGILINITNPCDIMTHYIYQKTGYDKHKIIGTGTCLDSIRLKSILARESGIDHKSIQAYMLGEHGESQMIPWSAVSFGAKPLSELQQAQPERFCFDYAAILHEVRFAGWKVLDGKGGTEYAIATSLAHLVNCIFHDEKQIIPVSALLEGQYGISDLHLSTPCIIGKDGIEEIIELKLTKEEQEELHASAKVMHEHYKIISN